MIDYDHIDKEFTNLLNQLKKEDILKWVDFDNQRNDGELQQVEKIEK